MITHENIKEYNDNVKQGNVILTTNAIDSDYCLTPEWIIKGVKKVFGGRIDTDPCTTKEANNKYIQAITYYTKKRNGLMYPWHGNVWAGIPYSAKLSKLFANKIKKEINSSHIESIIVLAKADTSTQCTDILTSCTDLRAEFKTRFHHAGHTIPKSSKNFSECLYYWGPKPDKFVEVFNNVCRIMMRAT